MRVGIFGMVVFIFIITSCAAPSVKFRANTQVSNETWQHTVFQSPYYLKTPLPEFSLMANATQLNFPVGDFTDIVIQGNARVEIVGGLQNAVDVYGPADSAKKVQVEVKERRMYVRTSKADDILVRLSLWHLFSLTNEGNANIVGKNVQSNHLYILNKGNGSINLAGDIRVEDILNLASGNVVILGATSQSLKIQQQGSGNILVEGHVNIENIEHIGSGRIHISGANSQALCINNMSKGILTIQGNVNIRSIVAGKNSQTFISCVRSKKIDITLCENAVLGIAGSSHILHLDATDQSCFLGASFLTNIAYVQARKKAHVNVAADERIFASASDRSSIYYYGPARILSDYPSIEGRVFPMYRHPMRVCGLV